MEAPDLSLDPFVPLAPGDDPATVLDAPAVYAPTGNGVEDRTTPEPYFTNAEHGVRLYLGDALDLLRRTRASFFDLIFADPPYFLSNDGITCQGGRMVSVNKGMWDKAETFEAIHAFNVEWLREYRRILKPNGTIWVSGTNHNIDSVGFAMQTLGYKVLNDIAWYKVNPQPNLACRYFTHATETILWARRDAKARHVFNYEEMKRIGDPTPGKQMQSLWRILPPTKWEKRYGKHPTQKPEALLDRIIRASTNPGDLVLDPFCGSGTTGVVAARHGRRFVGIDTMRKYLSVALDRLMDETPVCFITTTRYAEIPSRSQNKVTWTAIVVMALERLGGEGSLHEIAAEVASHPRANTITTWYCTIRRVVRQSENIRCVRRGRYALCEDRRHVERHRLPSRR